jgi:hypothetical protein
MNWYLVIGNFKYWFDGNVLNRAAPISNAEFRRRGLRYAARRGKKIGPWGRLINVKKGSGKYYNSLEFQDSNVATA